MNKKLYMLIILFCGVFLISGCVEDKSQATTENGDSSTDTSKNEEQIELLATATHASVDSSPKNWDADAEYDGIVINPSLKDANDNTVMFEGIELNVDVEIWTTKYNDNYDEIRDKQLYAGNGMINSWKDGNFLYSGGIQVSFDDFTATTDNDYGLLFVRIHTPNGKAYEAESTFVRLKP